MATLTLGLISIKESKKKKSSPNSFSVLKGCFGKTLMSQICDDNKISAWCLFIGSHWITSMIDINMVDIWLGLG